MFANLFAHMLPLVGVVVLGVLFKRYLLIYDGQWEGVNRLNYYVFIPSLIFGLLITSDIGAIWDWKTLVILLSLLLSAVLLLTILRMTLLKAASKPAITTLLQTSTRWDATIALVVAHTILDDTALSLISLSLILLVPIINILNVFFLTHYLTEEKASLAKLVTNLSKNPIFVACLAGAICAYLKVEVPRSIQQVSAQFGQASIPVTLLAVGSSIRLVNVKQTAIFSLVTVLIKMVACPAIVLFLCVVFKLEQGQTNALVLIAAMPSAMTGIALAREMGGDDVLYAEIGTFQTVLSVVTIPLWVLVLQLV